MKHQELKQNILDSVREYAKLRFGETAPFIPGESRINYGGRFFDEKEVVNLVDSALDFWLTAGPWAARFEESFAKKLGVKFCSVCNSGSSANLLAFSALTAHELGERRIRRGDEVITVAAGFPTTVAPIIQFGAVPVFVDVTVPQYNIDIAQLEAAYSEKTKAVMIAHTLGNPFDIIKVKQFCELHNLWLVEDNCDALGSEVEIDGIMRKTGTIGDLGTSSFYPPHHLTMGEGGAVYTNNPLLHRLVNSFRDWGRDCHCPGGVDNSCGCRFTKQFGALPAGYDHKYVYSHFGYNLKPTDLQAAIGCAQLEKLDFVTAARRGNWAHLREALDGTPGLILPEPLPGSNPSWFGFLISVQPDAGFTRNELVSHLESRKIQTRNLFAGNLLKHPAVVDDPEIQYRVTGALPQTDFIMNSTFWIGVYPGMSTEKLAFMASEIRTFIQTKRGKK